MKCTFTCPQCRRGVSFDDVVAGEVVVCPACRKGIVVPNTVQSAGGEDGAEVIPPEDFASAIAECRKNPEEDAFFVSAPRGARLFLGVMYYCRVFGRNFDDPAIVECLDDLAGDLQVSDIDYVLARERTPRAREWLLARRLALAGEPSAARPRLRTTPHPGAAPDLRPPAPRRSPGFFGKLFRVAGPEGSWVAPGVLSVLYCILLALLLVWMVLAICAFSYSLIGNTLVGSVGMGLLFMLANVLATGISMLVLRVLYESCMALFSIRENGARTVALLEEISRRQKTEER